MNLRQNLTADIEYSFQGYIHVIHVTDDRQGCIFVAVVVCDCNGLDNEQEAKLSLDSRRYCFTA